MKSNGNNILITGATGGIGQLVAKAFSRNDNTLFLWGRNQQKLNFLTHQLSTRNCHIFTTKVDFNLQAEISKACNLMGNNLKCLDVLIHCTGITSFGNIQSFGKEHMDQAIQVNLKAPVWITKNLLPQLIDGKGLVVFLNSRIIDLNRPGMGLYDITKSGLQAFADTLRNEYGSQGIRVTNLYLGKTATPMLEELHKVHNQTYTPEAYIQPKDVADMIKKITELPATAEITDLYIKHTRTNT